MDTKIATKLINPAHNERGLWYNSKKYKNMSLVKSSDILKPDAVLTARKVSLKEYSFVMLIINAYNLDQKLRENRRYPNWIINPHTAPAMNGYL